MADDALQLARHFLAQADPFSFELWRNTPDAEREEFVRTLVGEALQGYEMELDPVAVRQVLDETKP